MFAVGGHLRFEGVEGIEIHLLAAHFREQQFARLLSDSLTYCERRLLGNYFLQSSNAPPVQKLQNDYVLRSHEIAKRGMFQVDNLRNCIPEVTWASAKMIRKTKG